MPARISGTYVTEHQKSTLQVMQPIPIQLAPAQRGGELATSAIPAADTRTRLRRRTVMKCLVFAAGTLLCAHLGAQIPASIEALSDEQPHPPSVPSGQSVNT